MLNGLFCDRAVTGCTFRFGDYGSQTVLHVAVGHDVSKGAADGV